MEITQLNNLIAENIDKIASIDEYKKILNRGNGLYRFDVLNRLLISIQSNNSIDVKTNEEWLYLGRRVKNKQKPIFIMMPKISYKYIDSDSGETIDIKEFTPDELNEAIKYKIISKLDTIDTLYTLPVYDIKQTVGINGNSYEFSKPVLNSKNILGMTKSIMNCNLIISDETYYSKNDNTFYVKKQPYKELLNTISNIIVSYIIENNLDEAIERTSKLDKDVFDSYDKELINESLKFAIMSLFGVDCKCDFEYINHTPIDKILAILSIVDYLMISIIDNVEYTSINNNDAISNICKIKKAEVILDIMEANIINKKMKGI